MAQFDSESALKIKYKYKTSTLIVTFDIKLGLNFKTFEN